MAVANSMMHLLNPLRCRGTTLPPGLLLVGRFLALALILRRDKPFGRHLPFLEFLDVLGSTEQFNMTLRYAADAGYLLLLFSPFVRLGCLLIGGAFLIGLLGCRPCLSVAHTYVACVFLILSMSNHLTGHRLFRIQVVIVYAGACLNKALDLDWWSGHYFETWLLVRHQHALYAALASLFPPMALSKFMGAATILTQLVLTLCFLRHPWFTVGISIGLMFHGIMMVFMNATFGPFFVAIIISFVAFLEWPERIDVSLGESSPHRVLKKFLSSTDFDGTYHFIDRPVHRDSHHNGLEIRVNGACHRSFAGLQRLLFFNPAILFATVLPLTVGYASGWVRNTTFVVLVLFFSPLLARLVDGRNLRGSTSNSAE